MDSYFAEHCNCFDVYLLIMIVVMQFNNGFTPFCVLVCVENVVLTPHTACRLASHRASLTLSLAACSGFSLVFCRLRYILKSI